MEMCRYVNSLTDFKRHTAEFLAQLKTTGEPVVLTINGKEDLAGDRDNPVRDVGPALTILEVRIHTRKWRWHCGEAPDRAGRPKAESCHRYGFYFAMTGESRLTSQSRREPLD